MQAKKPKFEIYRSWFRYRWRLLAPNGEIIASGEGFFNEKDCRKSISRVQQYSPTAAIVHVTQ